ncbi:MAG TPA: class I SAM-dependent methyltransferase [Allosphingosinicella sp.]|jgi:predicted O-methyltransferase YrrM
MTTREVTGLLPRMGETQVVGGRRARTFREWAVLLAFGAITWPWLLRSLDGGRLKDKHALLDRLGLPDDALPYLGSWKADTGLLRLLVDHIFEHKPRLVVEFGTGASTLIIAKALKMAGGGTLISFDQHADFAQATEKWLAEHGLEADLRAVALRPSPGGWPGLWYDHGPLPADIDLMVIDGPPWTVHPMTRGAAGVLFDHIAAGGTVLLDDAARPGERLVARRWKKARPDFDFRLWNGGSKGTLISTKRR